MPPKKQIFQFKILLGEIEPYIWRSIQIPSTCTFWDLHVAIQDVMGWNHHYYEFKCKNRKGKMQYYGISTEEDVYMQEMLGLSKILPGGKHQISSLVVSTMTPPFVATYDLRDGWYPLVILESVLPVEEGVSYPRCIDGGRASPPENCGGPTGYLKMLGILRDPEATTYNSTREKLDSMHAGPFDPEKFVPSEVKFGDPKERFQER